jgi:hypothetical protein
MRKLHRPEENTAAVLLAVFVLRELSDNGVACHNTKQNKIKYIDYNYYFKFVLLQFLNAADFFVSHKRSLFKIFP